MCIKHRAGKVSFFCLSDQHSVSISLSVVSSGLFIVFPIECWIARHCAGPLSSQGETLSGLHQRISCHTDSTSTKRKIVLGNANQSIYIHATSGRNEKCLIIPLGDALFRDSNILSKTSRDATWNALGNRVGKHRLWRLLVCILNWKELKIKRTLSTYPSLTSSLFLDEMEWTKIHFMLEEIVATIINVHRLRPCRTEAELRPSSNFQPSTSLLATC